MNCIFRNLLVVSKSENIRLYLSDGSKYVCLISEYNSGFWEWFLYISLSFCFTMDRISSFSTGYSMISSDNDSHPFSIFLSFWKIENMSWVKNIKCTKTHHLVKLCIWTRASGGIDAIFRIWKRRIKKWHNTKRSQIEKKCCICTQKVHKF